jgi:molecular chaperone DnaK
MNALNTAWGAASQEMYQGGAQAGAGAGADASAGTNSGGGNAGGNDAQDVEYEEVKDKK